MNKHILPLALAVLSLGAAMPAAHAIAVRSEINWTQMQFTMDPGVSLVGHDNFYHLASAYSNLGSDFHTTHNPDQLLQATLNVPKGQISVESGLLGQGFRHDGLISVSSPGYSYAEFRGSEDINGRMQLNGEGWVHITIPYHFWVTPDLAGDNDQLTATIESLHRLRISGVSNPSFDLEEYRFFYWETDLPGTDSSVYQKRGMFSFDFYNVGSNSYLYDIGTHASIEFAPVPEPETWAMLGMGGVMLAVVKRRRGARAGGASRHSHQQGA